MNLTRRKLLAGMGMVSLAAPMKVVLGTTDESPISEFPQKAAFALPSDVTCLNNARWHSMPVGAVRSVQRYLEAKAQDDPEAEELIHEIQEAPRVLFARLINARLGEISYVPSTMVGESLIVGGMGLPAAGGNVVTDALHFEGSLYLYQALARQGLDVRIVKPRDWRIELNDVAKFVDNKTKLVAVSLVSFINGFQHDLKAICDLAHAHGSYVYADIIQAVGAIPVDVRASNVDFCACASYKWLMGDMGLGFLYVRQDLLGRVVKRTQYGYRQLSQFQYHIFPLDEPGDSIVEWRQGESAAHFFEVGTYANATLACLAYSLNYILELGVERIQAHTQSLLQRVKRELPALGYEPLTPPGTKSPIATFVVKEPHAVARRLAARKVDVSITGHRMRISPSVYNDDRDVDRLLEALSG